MKKLFRDTVSIFLASMIVGGCAFRQVLATENDRKQESTPALTPTIRPTLLPIEPAATVIPPTETNETQQNITEWGAFTGGTIDSVDQFIEATQLQPKIIATFVGWGENGHFPQEMADYALKNGAKLLIYWEPDESNLEMLDKDTANYIDSFAKALAKYPGEVILVPMPEMNGDWSDWDRSNPANTPETFKKAWKVVADLVMDLPNVQLAWAVNETTESVSEYYPGPNSTELVGVDGFNWATSDMGGWRSPDQIFGSTMEQLKELGKPIWIFSTASEEGEAKPGWISDLAKFSHNNGVAGIIWFNEDKERDWRIESSKGALQSFRISFAK